MCFSLLFFSLYSSLPPTLPPSLAPSGSPPPALGFLLLLLRVPRKLGKDLYAEYNFTQPKNLNYVSPKSDQHTKMMSLNLSPQVWTSQLQGPGIPTVPLDQESKERAGSRNFVLGQCISYEPLSELNFQCSRGVFCGPHLTLIFLQWCLFRPWSLRYKLLCFWTRSHGFLAGQRLVSVKTRIHGPGTGPLPPQQ